MKVFNVYRKLQHRLAVKSDFFNAKRRYLSSPDLLPEEKSLLATVSLQVHDSDEMYRSAFHYLSTGVSAIRCIEQALQSRKEPDLILDFPCGYGRVLRFLRVRFPNADITAAELDRSALGFCSRAFSVTPLLSKTPISDVKLDRHFDLIWCGSLFTHVNELNARDLLRFFHEHLSDRGVCVFTTHGQRSIERMQKKEYSYGLSEDVQQQLIREFNSTGYGYTDYAGRSGYGISVATHQRMCELAKSVGGWNETLFLEHGWDNHQDVYAFAV